GGWRRSVCGVGGGTVRGAPGMRRRQRVHAAAMLGLPLAGTIAAVALAARHGVGGVEVGTLVGMYAVTFIGISVGLHRLGAHRAFDAPPAVRGMLLGLGAMAAQGPATYWIAHHRRHHALSDSDGDLHSPRLGGLWHAHVGWMFDHELTNVLTYGKDLVGDPVIAALNRWYLPIVTLGLAIPSAIGGVCTGSWHGALSGLLWGGAVRLFATTHATSSINSIAHRFGSQPHYTPDHSRNNAWLAIPTFGDGWHNNHHAFPSSAFVGHTWWQVDLGALVIRGLEIFGLARDVKRPRLETRHDTTR